MEIHSHKAGKDLSSMAKAKKPSGSSDNLRKNVANHKNSLPNGDSKGQKQEEDGDFGVGKKSEKPPNPTSQELRKIGDSMNALRLQDDSFASTSAVSRAGSHVSGNSKTSSSLDDRLRDVVITESPIRPPSIDGRSYTSGVASALDEKESLRPDDSASVKAREDEEVSSVAESGVAETRSGAEDTAKIFRAQFHEISERMGEPTQTVESEESSALASTKALPIQFGAMINENPTAGDTATISKVALPPGFTRQDPDEKLLEALESPRDRNFLLRLEQDVIEFVKESSEPALDLEPSNSFYRLLSHRLADFYFLTHSVDHSTSRVRIYRTPFCRLPPPLTGISNPPTSENTPPPSTAPSVKIMRRGLISKGGQQLTRESSSANSVEESSKPTSESSLDDSGDSRIQPRQDPMEQVSAKDKATLTREEREAKYKEARERIFKGFEEGTDAEAESGTDKEKGVSRASSAAEKKRAGKRQRPKDDSFEARSQFAAFYPAPHYMMHSGTEASGFPAVQSQMGGPRPPTSYMQPPNHYGFSPTAPAEPHLQDPNTQWAPSQSPMIYGQPPNMMPPQHYSQNGGYPAHPGSVPNPQPGPHFNMPPPVGMSMSPVPNQPWTPPPHHATYPGQGPSMPHNSRSPSDFRSYSPAANGAPQGYYPYGQLPSPGNSNQRPQHPIPGSYNRNVYSQQGQSFTQGQGYMSPGPPGPGSPYGSSSMYPPVGRTPSFQGYGSHPIVPFTRSSSQPGSGLPMYNPSIGPPDPHRGSVPNLPYDPNGGTYGSQGSISNWATPASLPPRPSFTGQPPNRTENKPSALPTYTSSSQVPSN